MLGLVGIQGQMCIQDVAQLGKLVSYICAFTKY